MENKIKQLEAQNAVLEAQNAANVKSLEVFSRNERIYQKRSKNSGESIGIVQ